MAAAAARHDAMRIELLGPFRVSVGTHTLGSDAWRLRKAGQVVKLLALAQGHELHRDQVLESLWPELAPEAATNNLHFTLHAVRRTLAQLFPADQHAAREARRWLRLGGEVLSLAPPGGVWVDAEAFEQAAKEAARRGDLASHVAAAALYGGPLLPDERYEDWAAGRREQLRDLHIALLLRVAGLYEAEGRLAEATQALQRVLADDLTQEEAHVRLMRLAATTGHRNQALRQYRQLEEALKRELDAQPDPATRQLHQEILAGAVPTVSAVPPVPAGSASQSTALGGGELPAHNLPVAITEFVGRAQELAELARLLTDPAGPRLLTLSGAGGSGKTRLAAEVGHRLIGTFDSIRLVELAGLSEPAAVPQALAAAYGLPEQSDEPALATVGRALSGRHTLLVLDNCEHLLSAAAHAASYLLSRGLALRVLATSRQPLGITGERVWRVAALTVPLASDAQSVETLEEYESVRLFVSRARLIRPEFTLARDTAAAVAQICAQLDGLPLAIELAAARLSALSAAQIAARLEERFGLLTTGSRTAPARHQSLRLSVDWSYDLLSEAEQVVFRRLAVFASGFTLEAAEAVLGGERSVTEERYCPRSPIVRREHLLDLVSQLVDKSLLTASAGPAGTVRYGMLEILREYGIERLAAADEEADARQRHAAYCVALVERAAGQLSGPDQAAWLEQLALEHDNLRAALGWAAESADNQWLLRLAGGLRWFWQVRGHFFEGERWLQAALARAEQAPAETQANLMSALGHLTSMRGEYARAAALHQAALALRRQAGLQDMVGWSLISLGNLAYHARDFPVAGRHYAEALDVLLRQGETRGAATALTNLAYVDLWREDYTRAAVHCRESLALSSTIQDERGMALAQLALGHLARRQGDADGAAALYRQALATFHSLGAPRDEATALESLALAAILQDAPARAARLFGVAAAVRAAIQAPASPADREEHAQALATLRGALGESGLQAALSAGGALAFDVVVRDEIAGSV